MFYVVHLLACIWTYIGVRLGDEGWIANQEEVLGVSDIFHVYLAAFYWVIETFSTVGYGDISG